MAPARGTVGVGWHTFEGDPNTPVRLSAGIGYGPPRLIGTSTLGRAGTQNLGGADGSHQIPWDTTSWPDSASYYITMTAFSERGAPVTHTVAPNIVDNTPPRVQLQAPLVTVQDGRINGVLNTGPVNVRIDDNIFVDTVHLEWRNPATGRSCVVSVTPFADPGPDMRGGVVRADFPGGCIVEYADFGAWILTVRGFDLSRNYSKRIGPFGFLYPPVCNPAQYACTEARGPGRGGS